MDTYEVAAQQYWPALIGFVQSCGILDGVPSAGCSAALLFLAGTCLGEMTCCISVCPALRMLC